MKKRMMAVVLAAGILAGAWGGEARGDRLNLWPLLSVEEGTVDVLWPIAHFKSGKEWRVFPVIRDDDLFTVFPELWWTEDAFAVLPLVAQKDFRWGMVFPVAWWDFEGRGEMHSLFPVYWWSSRGDGRHKTFWAACGLGGWRQDGEHTSHWLWPLYAKRMDGDFWSIPYTRAEDGDGGYGELYLCGLAGREVGAGGETDASWCFPLWYKSTEKLLTLPLCLSRDGEGKVESWFSLPLLSWGVRDGEMWRERYLLGLGGRGKDEKTGFRQSWAAPLYYEDSEGRFITPLFGKTKEAQWCFPMWYKDERSFYSALWCERRNEAGEAEFRLAPPLLSWFSVEGDGTREFKALLGLAGAKWGGERDRREHWVFPLYSYTEGEEFATLPLSFYRKEDGTRELFVLTGLAGATWGGPEGGRRSSWAFPLWYENSEGTFVTPVAGKAGAAHWAVPLYYANRKTGTIATLPWGRTVEYGQTNTWWATPLVGTYSGTKTGGWFFPLFNREKDAAFDGYEAWMEAGEVPEEIQFSTTVETWTNPAGKVVTWTNVVPSMHVHARISGSFLVLSDHDRSVWGGMQRPSYKRWEAGEVGEGKYELHATSKQGNRLFFNRESSRTVAFDTQTRRKTGETAWAETMALCGLFHHTHRENLGAGPEGGLSAGETHTRTRVLWKLWDRQEDNGDVRIDAFPGFTHDSRTNGYTKTSFLWRFFRHEHDPETGKTAVDVLFVPVWR